MREKEEEVGDKRGKEKSEKEGYEGVKEGGGRGKVK